MPQMEQNDTQQHAETIDGHIPQSRPPAGDKDLDGFIDTGSCNAPQQGKSRSFLTHGAVPGQQHTQGDKLRQVSQLSQQEAFTFLC